MGQPSRPADGTSRRAVVLTLLVSVLLLVGGLVIACSAGDLSHDHPTPRATSVSTARPTGSAP